jgi:hypothetical protein
MTFMYLLVIIINNQSNTPSLTNSGPLLPAFFFGAIYCKKTIQKEILEIDSQFQSG